MINVRKSAQAQGKEDNRVKGKIVMALMRMGAHARDWGPSKLRPHGVATSQNN